MATTEVSEARATAKFVRMAPRKVRLVLDAIRGKYAKEALDILHFTPNFAALEISKVLRSACANAENNFDMSPNYLKVTKCYVDPGPTLKRVRARAQGRAYRILKRTSHITVIVSEGEAPPVKTGKKAAKPPLRAAIKAPTTAAPVEETGPAQIVDETATAAEEQN